MSVIWVSSIILEYCSVFFTHTELTETFPNDKNGPKSRVFLVILLPANMWGFLSVAQRLKHSELGKMWDVTRVSSFSNTVWDGSSEPHSEKGMSFHKC